jgi:putative acetyltransferase
MIKDILIRTEQVADYAEIASVTARAFAHHLGVPLIVALQRQRREFDPELSLVAEKDGRIVGHVLFSPYRMRLLAQTVPSVNLSPISVDPECQRQGIGGQLIAEGHARAAAKGYTVSTLLGHPTYYPRFGYHTFAFGHSELTYTANTSSGEALETRGPNSDDVPMLRELWQHEEQDVDLALEPGHDLLDWLSPNPAIKSTVYTHAGKIVGYTRTHQDEPNNPRFFLAASAEAARSILATMAREQANDASEVTFTLPLHPYSASTSALGSATSTPWEAGMAYELAPSPLPDYLAALQEKHRPAGRPIWPVAFDLS